MKTRRVMIMNHKPRYLYSVWRNSDDKLMILDGTAEECAEIMNMSRQSFYKMVCMGGCNESWTILKSSREQIKAESTTVEIKPTMDIRLYTRIIIKKGNEYLVGRIAGTSQLKWSISPWDAWFTRDAIIAKIIAERVNGMRMLFNPVSKQLREYRNK